MDEEEELENTLIGQQEEAPAVSAGDVMMGGLGLGGAAYAAQTGQLPTATPQGPLSPFAQQVRANDAARLAAQNRPVLIGTGSSASGVTNPRLVPGTNIVPTGQPPAVTSTGGPPATTSASAARSASDFDFRLNRAQPTRLARFGGPGALIYGAADVGTKLATGTSLSERIGEGLGGAVGNLLFPGAQSQPAFTEDELQQSRDNLSLGAQMDIMREDAEASVAPVTEVTPLEAGLGVLDKEIAGRESNIVNNQVELAKQIRELGTVTDEQRAAQDFLNERAERAFEKPTDVITPFQEQAELTADLFTDPNTAIGQFVPRSTSTLPDGTIIQEDEGGNRREISPEQLRQFEQDMAGLGQAQQSRTFSQQETMDRLGGRTLNEYLNAPPGTPGVSGLRTDPQGRMIPNQPQPVASQPVAPQPATTTQPPATTTQPPVNQLSRFEEASLERQQRIGGTGSFEGDSEARDARVRENERRPGESQADRDTRVAQSKTTGGQTGGMSFDDARRRAEGQLAARGVRNPTASQINALARSIQQGEPERLEDERLKRDLTQSRIDLIDKQLANAGIVPVEDPVLDPETGVFMQLYSDGVRRIKGNARAPSPSFDDIDELVGDKAELPEALKNSNPSDFKGQTIRDKQGNTYTSDGTKWIRV